MLKRDVCFLRKMNTPKIFRNLITRPDPSERKFQTMEELDSSLFEKIESHPNNESYHKKY